MFFKKKNKLSESIEVGKILVNKEVSGFARVNKVTVDKFGNMSVFIHDAYFELEIRSPRVFDELFKDWDWKNQ